MKFVGRGGFEFSRQVWMHSWLADWEQFEIIGSFVVTGGRIVLVGKNSETT